MTAAAHALGQSDAAGVTALDAAVVIAYMAGIVALGLYTSFAGSGPPREDTAAEQVSTRILGRRTAPFPTFPYSFPRPACFTEGPSTDSQSCSRDASPGQPAAAATEGGGGGGGGGDGDARGVHAGADTTARLALFCVLKRMPRGSRIALASPTAAFPTATISLPRRHC